MRIYWLWLKNRIRFIIWKIKKILKLTDKNEKYQIWEYICPRCHQSSEFLGSYPPSLNACQKCEKTTIHTWARTIPTWRLHIDDMTSEEVLRRSPREYGMPHKTYREWISYYANTPYEQEKMRKFNEEKKRQIKELLGSSNLANPKDGK